MGLNEMKITNYLDQTCSLVKNKRVHSEIKNELKSHIDKLRKHYKKLGHSDEESISLALNDMGDSSKLGSELNQTHKSTFDFKLLSIVAILFLIGLLGTLTFGNYGSFSFGNLECIPVVLIAFFVGSKINFRWFLKLSIPFYIIGIVIYLLYQIRTESFGFILGFTLGMITLNRHIYIPILILFGLSGIFLKFKFDNIKNISLAILLSVIPLLIFGLPLLRTIKPVLEPNGSYLIIGAPNSLTLPMILCYSIGVLFIIYLHSKNLKVLIATAIIELIIISATTFKEVKLLFTNNSWGMYSTRQTLLSSHFINTSLTPDPINNSYPLISLIGYFGWFAGIIVIVALIYFIFRLYKASFVINNIFGKSLALSISTVISVRVLIGLLMNVGLFPYLIMPTPLLSYAGLSLITTIFLLGILTNIYKVKTLAKA
ncbi:FtsW/RodA/SpoVE family cell cycle protein [uncultured Clostridium sp.]|uniref:FtsW/RodA/SpoVE family cell cycle protein n=1 Tax=uncultured Clostridium sp. TaxID=59620 RepID=UPI00260D9427|nr:FtsW/RodA/SpoVE family cell cycle protein [uncultured Clostridium sp.]